MQNSQRITYVCVEDKSAEQLKEKYISRSITISMIVTLIAISVISWADNHYQEKLREARQAGAASCQAPVQSGSASN